MPSRFLEEIPGRLIENLGNAGLRGNYGGGQYGRYGGRGAGRDAGSDDGVSGHYSYEDEDQSSSGDGLPGRPPARGAGLRATPYPSAGGGFKPAVWPPQRGGAGTGAGAVKPAGKPAEPDSIDNIAKFFGGGKGSYQRPKLDIPEPTGAAGFKKGSRVLHGKYGEGIVILREGDGEDAKLTVHFAKFGVKKLVEKFAQLKKL